MLIVFLFVLIIYAFFELTINKDSGSKIYVYSATIVLCLIEGLRWYSGTDFFMYYNSYESLLLVDIEKHNQRYDILYYWLSYFFKALGLDYTFFLLFLSFFSGFLYMYSLIKISKFPIIAMMFLFVNLIGFLGCNRQLIALSIVFFSVRFLIEEKKILFVLLILLATGFHYTAIVMLILVFFNRRISFKTWLIIVLITFLISLTPIIPFGIDMLLGFNVLTPHLKERFISYLNINEHYQVNYLFSLLGTIKRLLPILIIWYFKNKDKENTSGKQDLLLNIAFFSLILYIICAQHFQFFLGRLTIYFSIFECIVYAWGFGFINNSKYKYHITFVFFVFCIIVFFKSISPYPELFIPYRTRFFTL